MHSQHCWQNVENNNNSAREFLSDFDLFSAFPHSSMYLKIMTDFTLKNIVL